MKKRKIASALCSLLVCGTFMTTTIFADTTQTINYDSTVNDSGKTYSDVSVEAERAELYSVTLPKTVTLEVTDTTAEYNYEVDVTGEIGAGNYVRVIPLDGATLINEKSADEITLNVTQEKRRFAADELTLDTPITATGVYTATDVQPGKYAGNVRYMITLDDGAEWVSASCTTPATRIGEDTNDNGVIEESEKDTTTVTRGNALGHSYPADRSFTCMCTRCNATCFAIATPEHLIEFANAVNAGNTYEGATVYLCNDLDLKGYDVPSIGQTGFNVFRGTFDGKNYKMYNYKMDATLAQTTLVPNSSSSIRHIGLFGYCDAESICNFTMVNPAVHVTVDSVQNYDVDISFLIGEKFSNYCVTDVSNVHVYNGIITVEGSITAAKNLRIGGLCSKYGYETLNFSNCSVTGNINNLSTGWYETKIAGILPGGCVNEAIIIANCFVAINVMSNSTYTADSVMITDTNVGSTINIVYNSDLTVSKYGTGLTTDACKTQEAIDILNTDNTECVWQLDLENVNNGYPVVTT